MKKFIYIILGTLITLLIAIVVLNFFQPTVKPVTDEEIIQQFDSGESFVFVMGSTTCGYCIEYKEDVLPLYLKQKNELPLYFAYSDTSFPSTSAYQQFLADYGFTGRFEYVSSPSTFIVKNGQIVAMKAGKISIDDLNDFVDSYK